MSISATSATAAAKVAVPATTTATTTAASTDATASAESGSSSKSTASVTSANGLFYVTGSDGTTHVVDMGTLMLQVNVEYVDMMDAQLELQVEVMEDRNFQIKAATEVLTQLRSLKTSGTDDGNPTDFSDAETLYITVDGVTKVLQGEGSWIEYLGIDYTDVNGNRPSNDDDADTWDARMEANIQNVKSAIDLLNNDSEIDSIKLQDLMDKRSNAVEQASNLMKSRNEALESLNNNL